MVKIKFWYEPSVHRQVRYSFDKIWLATVFSIVKNQSANPITYIGNGVGGLNILSVNPIAIYVYNTIISIGNGVGGLIIQSARVIALYGNGLCGLNNFRGAFYYQESVRQPHHLYRQWGRRTEYLDGHTPVKPSQSSWAWIWATIGLTAKRGCKLCLAYFCFGVCQL